MTGDNGKDLKPEPQAQEPQKPPEQLASERLARYQANPGKFVEFSEIVVCIKRNPLATYISGTQIELQIAWADLNESLMGVLRQMKLENAMRQQAAENLIKKPGAMMNFARKIAGRK